MVFCELDEDYIEVHHCAPLSTYAEASETKLEDLALLCSNCHRMILRKKSWPTIEEFKNIFK